MRPRPGYPNEKNPYGIWMVERKQERWSKPQYVGYGMYVTTSCDGIVYLTDITEPKVENHSIAKTTLQNCRLTELIKQSGGVLTPAPDRIAGRHPCIAPDESFIVFDAYLKEKRDGGRLFVCFRKEENTWSKAKDLGEVIGFEKCLVPSLSHDGKYLFFTFNGDIYWMDAKVIENLKPKELK